jgi:hypothetical protein
MAVPVGYWPNPTQQMAAGSVDQWISGSVVEGAPTEELRPDASKTRGANDPPQGQLACLVLLSAC